MTDLFPLPIKKYKTILADCPWRYRNKKTGGSMVSGVEAKYPTMSLEELHDLPVKEIADKNAVLFFWVTTPLKYEIAQAKVIENWGFEYKTTIFWRKIMSLGMGFWFRGQVEECWVCTRGKVKAFRCQKPNFIQSKVRKHSQKPEEFFELIEPQLDKYELNPRIELFAREARPGWSYWGNHIQEATK
jgi:N6-adenosine-specific RNA methylase IME4